MKNRYRKLNPGYFWLSAAAFRPALCRETHGTDFRREAASIRCIIDSFGDAATAALALGDIELVKPNLKELSALLIAIRRSLADAKRPVHSVQKRQGLAGWSLWGRKGRWA
ncbi:hypothetical protein KCP75_08800 [Salmonella enterica subsp. enterica]|nr:hypothetical protein KCP75_08800 [Salmonella enterica subsp. enterica]